MTKANPIKYRKYSQAVRAEIARCGNIYLFPDLKIPRTTAQYWKKSKSAKGKACFDNENIGYRQTIEFLQRELERERSLRKLVEYVRSVFPYDFQTAHVK